MYNRDWEQSPPIEGDDRTSGARMLAVVILGSMLTWVVIGALVL